MSFSTAISVHYACVDVFVCLCVFVYNEKTNKQINGKKYTSKGEKKRKEIKFMQIDQTIAVIER